MKLLLITTIKEFEKNVKDLLVHSGGICPTESDFLLLQGLAKAK